MGLGGAGPLCSWGFLELAPFPHTDPKTEGPWLGKEASSLQKSWMILSTGLSFPMYRMETLN